MHATITQVPADTRAHLETLHPIAADPAGAEELFARIAWSRITEPGDLTASLLVRRLGAKTALEQLVNGIEAVTITTQLLAAGHELSRAEAHAALTRWEGRLSRVETVKDIQRAAEANMRLLTPSSVTWPTAQFNAFWLAPIHSPEPLVLWARGNTELLHAPAIAISGARAATGYGHHVTTELVHGLADENITIVSGLAYGVDAVAHRAALQNETPTIAVLAGGLDRIYPAAHGELANKSATHGLLLSEVLPGAAPTRHRFIMRNRLIAAITDATIITEAAKRSGSLKVAEYAAQFNRPVGAVPDPITSAASTGCHDLIREYGAVLITSADDAIALMPRS